MSQVEEELNMDTEMLLTHAHKSLIIVNSRHHFLPLVIFFSALFHILEGWTLVCDTASLTAQKLGTDAWRGGEELID